MFRNVFSRVALLGFALPVLFATLMVSTVAGKQELVSTPFEGVKANTGTVTLRVEAGVQKLTLSDDFVVPDTPDPHWQVVDRKGNVYLLDRLVIKPDTVTRTIDLPAYVPNVARVQIWCAFAEALLGEAVFPTQAS